MPGDVLVFLGRNWAWLLLGGFLAVLTVWAMMENDEDRTAKEVGEAVSDRASRAVGGSLGAGLAVLIGLVGVVIEAGVQVADLWIEAPTTLGGVFATVLGWAGLAGIIQISPLQYIGVALVVLGIGVILTVRTEGEVA